MKKNTYVTNCILAKTKIDFKYHKQGIAEIKMIMVNDFVSYIQFVQIYLWLVIKYLGSLRLQLQLRRTWNKKMATVFGTFVLNS